MTPATGRRAQNRERIESEILALGRAQVAQVGAAALSLRAIARDLGMASSAVYRYVASRDELLTRLIVESYDQLADAVQDAEAAVSRGDPRGRWFAIGHGMRDWALDHPHDWALLYGSPVPGYAAPADRTNDPGTRVTSLAIAVLVDIVAAGRAAPAIRAEAPLSRASLAAARHTASTWLADSGLDEQALPPEVFVAGITAWTMLVGAINAEIFEYFGPLPGDPVGLFDAALDAGTRLLLA